MKKVVQLGALCLAVALVVGGYVLFDAWNSISMPIELPEDRVVFAIADGESMGSVARRLNALGVIEEPRVLTWYAQLIGDATRIQAGEFEIEDGMSASDILAKLVDGDVIQYSITIIEGITFEEMLRVVRGHEAISRTELNGAEIMAYLGAPNQHPEGRFMPDTYRFPRDTRDLTIFARAHESLRRTLSDAWDRRGSEIAVQNPDEALILASIIEKETALSSERREISGVFHRRLARRMRLQTDPTVIYGLGSEFDGNLRRADLQRDTPYNTYTRHGLPPTPIALPGAESIVAAVDPQPGESLYFVATGRPDGSHYFSETLEEHNRAVARYLNQLQNNSP